MTDPVKEQLSACLDGELPEAELGLLLRQVERDRHVLGSLSRYSLISEALKTRQPVVASASFADRVSAAIDAEAQPAKRIAPLAPRWMRPAAGFAIAAGVAAIAVISLQPSTIQTPQVAAVADTGAESAAAPSYTVPTNVASVTDAEFVPAARLTNYVVAHSEYSSPLGRRTVLSGVLSDDEGQEGDDVAVNVTGSASESPETQR